MYKTVNVLMQMSLTGSSESSQVVFLIQWVGGVGGGAGSPDPSENHKLLYDLQSWRSNWTQPGPHSLSPVVNVFLPIFPYANIF